MTLKEQNNIAFSRQGQQIRICLDNDERKLVLELAEQFRLILVSDRDPDLSRLYPTAYPDNADQNNDYEELVHDDLVKHHLSETNVVIDTLGKKLICHKELTSWMGMLNALRLFVGTRLDIGENDVFDPESSDAPSRALLAWLGYLLEEAVDVSTNFLTVVQTET